MTNDFFIKKYLNYITQYNKKYLLAIDFDGTLATNIYPDAHGIGEPTQIDLTNYIDSVCAEYNLEDWYYLKNNDDSNFFTTTISLIDILKYWSTKGDKFILWTCRSKDLYKTHNPLQDAIDWCNEKGLYFEKHNENMDYIDYNPRKILADKYIDDKSCNILDWKYYIQADWNIKDEQSFLNNNYDFSIDPNFIKSCPMCGSTPTLWSKKEGTYFFIECEKCGLNTKPFHNKGKDELIKYWNKLV